MKSITGHVIVVLMIAYVGLAVARVSQPFVDDETWEFYASKTLVEEGQALQVTGEPNVFHPHGYYYAVGALFEIFGAHEASARWVGIVATLLTFLFMRVIVRRLRGRPDPVADVWIAALYFLSPAVIQGSLIITADTALHQLTTTALIAWVVSKEPMARRDFVILGLLFAGSLWVKIVTPCLVLLGIGLYFLSQRDVRRFWATTVWSVGIGLGLFLTTWAIYCLGQGVSAATAFEYILSVSKSRADVPSLASKAVWLVRMSVVVALWVGLPYCLLLLGTWGRRWRETLDPSVTLLLIVATITTVIFTFIAGASYGYPRYHFATLPIFAVLGGLRIASSSALRQVSPFALTSGIIATGLFLLVLAPDPLHLINFDLKLTQLGIADFGAVSVREIARGLAITGAPVLVAIGLAWILSRRLREPGSELRPVVLGVVTLGGFLALDAQQLQAPYHTHLSYGERGTREVHAIIKERARPDALVVAGKDIVYHTVDRDFMHDYRWTEPEYLLTRLSDPRTQFFVMGVNHNTIAQFRMVHDDPRFQDALATFQRRRVGTYLLWERSAPRVGVATSPEGESAETASSASEPDRVTRPVPVSFGTPEAPR